MKNKIAVFYQGASTFGGIENYLENLFRDIDPDKFELTLISLGDWELAERIEKNGGRVIRLDFKWYRFRMAGKLKELVRTEKFELIISQVMVANFYARLVSAATHVPNLVVIHSDPEFDYTNGMKPFIYQLSEKMFRRYTKHYVCVSQYLKTKMVERGIPAEKISIVYNAVNPLGVPTRRPGKELVLGSLGRLHYAKGYHNLIEAMSLIKDLPLKLSIWGEGPERQGLSELIARLGLADKVILQGFEKDLSKVFGQVDIYIQPSLSEGFGLSVVEAMLAAKPIIVTPAGSLPELITDDKTGIVAGGLTPEAIAAAVKALASDRKLMVELGQAAKKDAEKRFSKEQWLSETTRVMSEVIR